MENVSYFLYSIFLIQYLNTESILYPQICVQQEWKKRDTSMVNTKSLKLTL